MKKIISITALALVLSQVATAEVVTQTKEAAAQTIAVGQCSEAYRTSLPTLAKSEFSYTVCQEKVTAQYNKVGSGWNAKYDLIAGTEVRSYEILNKTGGHSAVIQEDADIFALMSISNACQSIRSAMQKSIVSVSKTNCR